MILTKKRKLPVEGNEKEGVALQKYVDKVMKLKTIL